MLHFYEDILSHSDEENSLSDTEETQSNAEDDTTAAPLTSNITEKARRIIWKHVLGTDDIIFPSTTFNRPPIPDQSNLQLPIEYFNDFTSHELKNTIVDQSNLYSVQNDIEKSLNLSLSELEQWMDMCMYFSLNKIPNTVLHWSLNFRNNAVVDIMSRDCWTKIKANLHLTDNQNIDPGDPLYKISCKKSFEKY